MAAICIVVFITWRSVIMDQCVAAQPTASYETTAAGLINIYFPLEFSEILNYYCTILPLRVPDCTCEFRQSGPK